MSVCWRVDSLGAGPVVERAFDTEAQARVVEAELLRLTSSLRVVLWCCVDAEEGAAGVGEPGNNPGEAFRSTRSRPSCSPPVRKACHSVTNQRGTS